MAIATGTALALGALGSAGASIFGAKKASDASKKAAEQQLAAGREAIGYQAPLYEQARGGFEPYAQTGGQGLTSLAGLLGVGGGPIGEGLEQTPGYQFRLNEGLKALERSAASRGTLLTGGTLKGMQRYAQDVASQEYGNRVNQLTGLANLGYNATGQQANVLGQQASTIGNALTGQGNVAAAGTIGSGNAWQQGFGDVANVAQMYYLSRLLGQPAGGAAPAGTAATPAPTSGVAPSYAGQTDLFGLYNTVGPRVPSIRF